MKKMYVLVRKDLPKSYQAVQGGHALAEYLIHFPQVSNIWKNGTLIYLGVKDEQMIIKWMHKLERNNVIYKPFKEPDLGNQFTALACISDGRVFKRLSLL